MSGKTAHLCLSVVSSASFQKDRATQGSGNLLPEPSSGQHQKQQQLGIAALNLEYKKGS